MTVETVCTYCGKPGHHAYTCPLITKHLSIFFCVLLFMVGLFFSVLFYSAGAERQRLEREFTKVCEAAGGKTAWDGGRFQCIAPSAQL